MALGEVVSGQEVMEVHYKAALVDRGTQEDIGVTAVVAVVVVTTAVAAVLLAQAQGITEGVERAGLRLYRLEVPHRVEFVREAER